MVLFWEAWHLFYVVSVKKLDRHGADCTGLVLQLQSAVVTFGYFGTLVEQLKSNFKVRIRCVGLEMTGG